MGLCLLLFPSPQATLLAVPPIDVDVVDTNTVEVSWPDTGEDVRLEASSDLGNTLPWQVYPGDPELSNGRFRQSIDAEENSGTFFRLTGSNTTAPTFVNPPGARVVFPGQTVQFTLSASDPSGKRISFLADSLPLPSGASLNRDTGEFIWTTSEGQIGTSSVTFLAFNGSSSGRLPVSITVEQPPADGITALSGILLDTTDAVGGGDRPVVGAVVSILNSGVSMATGEDGRFVLTGIPEGLQVLDIATANAQPAPDGSPYAGFREAIKIVEGITNIVERPFYMPRLNVESLTPVNPNLTTRVENKTLGVSITVPPHTAMMDDEEFTGELSISDVPEALAPATLPVNLGFGQLVTIQPVGVRFTDPVPITFPNYDQLLPGSEVDIWSLDPDAGEFAIVGKGRVTDDGEFIETIEGGVIAADWHGALPPAVGAGGGPGASGGGMGSPGGDSSGDGGPGDDGGGDPPGCPGDSNSSAGGYFGSQVLLADGAVVTSVATPGYVSGGRRRSLEFIYHSLTASPQVIIPLEATISVRSAVPNRVSITGTLGGLTGGQPVFYDTSTLSESRDETFSAGFAIDGRGLETGFAPYSLRATSHFDRSFVSVDLSDRAVIVNRSESAVGAGWGIAGDQRIIRANDDDSALLLVSGDGSYRLFRDGAAFSSFKIAAFGGERASNYSFVEGSFFSQARGAIADSFPEVSFQSIETVAQASDAEVLVLTQYASATEGAPLSVAEQSALTSFIRSGGCAIVFLDHDLGRASFVQARNSLLQPFGISGDNTEMPGGAVRPSGHPLMSSDFGIVSRVDLPFGGFEIDAATNAQLEVISPGEVSPNSARIAVLPEGELAAGSGPVIFIADTQAYSDASTIGFDGDSSHRALVLNAILYCLQANRDPNAVVEYVGPAGEFSRLSLLADGTFERWLPNGARYEFNTAGRLVRAIERDGEATVFTYSGGNLTRIGDPFGRQTQLSYSGGQLTQVIDPVGRRTSFQHDAEGNLVQVTLPDSSVVGYEYDANHLMTAEINPVGGRTEREYDSFGRALTSTLPDGSMIQARSLQGLAADLGGTEGTAADPAPVKRPEDVVASYTNAAGETEEVIIGPFGTASRVTDSAGRVTETGRDANGKPVTITYPAGRQFSAEHDRQGRRTSLTDSATGSNLTVEYDPISGAVTTFDNGRGEQALFEYDETNRLTAFTGFGGRRTAYSYVGSSSLPSSMTLPSGRQTSFQYDASGNRTEIVSEGSAVSLRYSAAGYLSGLTDAEEREFSFEYDAAGNLTSSNLPGGMTVGYSYDDRGLRTGVTTPANTQFDLTYDQQGNFLSLATPLGDRLSLAYEYRNGRREVLRWGDGTQVDYAYSNGNLASISTGEDSTVLNYSDTTGLLDQIVFSENDRLNYAYDAHGRLLLSTWSGIVNGSVGRAYDNRGRVSALEINGGANMPITYDADDLVVSTGPMTVTRDAASGNIVATTVGKCTDTWSYNSFDELLNYTAMFDGTPRYVLTLTRDKLGRVVTKTETMGGTTLQMEYVYSPEGRLIREVRGTKTIDYIYDANGNRLARNETGAAGETGAYNSGDQLVNYAGSVYSYDGCGRLRQRGSDTFTYGALGGLQSAELSGGATVTYVHPAGGRRISESANGVVRRQFLYQDSLHIIAELNGAGSIEGVFGYVTLRGAADFMVRDGRTYRIISDHLGSPRLVVDCESGEVAQMMRHDAFGRVLEDSSPRFQPFGFAGGIYDADTQLVRFGARDYDPNTGRWTAPDPSLFNGSTSNLYAYANADPVNYVDRNGLDESPAASGGSCGGGSSLGAKCMADGGEVFTGPLASDALNAVGARASTAGDGVFLDASNGDGALYAHEKYHQETGGSSSCGGDNHNDAEEESAEAVERLVLGRFGSGNNTAPGNE